jgi:hypothetical protein
VQIVLEVSRSEAHKLKAMLYGIFLDRMSRHSVEGRTIARTAARQVHKALYPFAVIPPDDAYRNPLTWKTEPDTLHLEHSLSTPEQQANLLTRMALRNSIDASTFDAVASNLRSLEQIWFNTYLRQVGVFSEASADVESYRVWRAAAILALLDESK